MIKKIQLIALMIPLAMLLINCSSTRTGKDYAAVKKLSYNTDVKPIIANSCTPCHMPPQGRKEPLENYEHVKQNIAAIIERVSLPQDNRKVMPPVNKKAALTEAQIAVLVKWQQQNMPE
ncbi:MAG: hypothetical protein ABI554_14570 [Flavobacterium sp.]